MENELSKYGEVIVDASLEKYNTYGIKSTCDYLVKPDSIDNLVSLLEYISSNNLEYYILGGGSNIILPDHKINKIIINLSNLNNISLNDNTITAEAGISLAKLAQYAISNSLSGFEYIALIPGTLGGALYGNAGVKDHEIYDNVLNVLVIRDNKLIKLNKGDIDIRYRYTSFKENNDIIVGAVFKLENGNIEEMNNIVKENRLKRLNSQPLEYKNAGSVFKNPIGDSAGRLIDSLNLKGFHIGDAYVSDKHANFIINKGNATSKDIKELINYVKEKVSKEYNINLELEQIIVE